MLSSTKQFNVSNAKITTRADDNNGLILLPRDQTSDFRTNVAPFVVFRTKMQSPGCSPSKVVVVVVVADGKSGDPGVVARREGRRPTLPRIATAADDVGGREAIER
jgi:hypothetical protein